MRPADASFFIHSAEASGILPQGALAFCSGNLTTKGRDSPALLGQNKKPAEISQVRSAANGQSQNVASRLSVAKAHTFPCLFGFIGVRLTSNRSM